MAVLDAQGSQVEFFDADGITPNVVGNVQSFNLGGASSSEIDITTLSDTAKTYRSGLQDFGSCQLECLWDPADAGQAEMVVAKAAGATRKVVITLPGAQTATFNAFVKSIDQSGGVDAVVTASIELRVTGAVTWA